ARAAGTVETERHVRKFAGHIVASAQQLAVDDHADADAVGDADKDQVARRRGIASRLPDLREGTGAPGVFDLDWKTGRRGEPGPQIDVAPPESWRVDDASVDRIDHAGHGDADAAAGADRFGARGEELTDGRRQGGHEPLRVA